MNYSSKYLKYKSKYLELKKLKELSGNFKGLNGGGKCDENILKDNKISKNSFESGLMGTITPKVLHALCIFYGINIFYVHNCY